MAALFRFPGEGALVCNQEAGRRLSALRGRMRGAGIGQPRASPVDFGLRSGARLGPVAGGANQGMTAREGSTGANAGVGPWSLEASL